MKTFIRQIEERWTFTEKEWNKLSDAEKKEFEPLDGTYDWPEEPPEIPKKEKQDRAFQNYGKFQMENLRLKPGQVYPIAGGKVEIIAWGPRVHFIKYIGNNKVEKFGVVARLTEDSSYGTRDIMREYPQMTTFKTREQAEQAFHASN